MRFIFCILLASVIGLPWCPVVKNPPANAGDRGSIPGAGRCLGGGHGNPLLYSCLENPMDSGGWRATVHGVSVSQTGLSDLAAHTHGLLQTGKPMKGEPQRP